MIRKIEVAIRLTPFLSEASNQASTSSRPAIMLFLKYDDKNVTDDDADGVVMNMMTSYKPSLPPSWWWIHSRLCQSLWRSDQSPPRSSLQCWWRSSSFIIWTFCSSFLVREFSSRAAHFSSSIWLITFPWAGSLTYKGWWGLLLSDALIEGKEVGLLCGTFPKRGAKLWYFVILHLLRHHSHDRWRQKWGGKKVLKKWIYPPWSFFSSPSSKKDPQTTFKKVGKYF